MKLYFYIYYLKVQTQIGIKHSKKRFDEMRKYQKQQERLVKLNF